MRKRDRDQSLVFHFASLLHKKCIILCNTSFKMHKIQLRFLNMLHKISAQSWWPGTFIIETGTSPWCFLDSTRTLDLGPPALREKPDPMKRVTSSFRIRSMSSLKSDISFAKLLFFFYLIIFAVKKHLYLVLVHVLYLFSHKRSVTHCNN